MISGLGGILLCLFEHFEKNNMVCSTTSTNTHTNPLSEHYIKWHTWQLYNEHSHSCYSPAAEMIACPSNQQRRPASTRLIRLHVLLLFKRSMSGSVHLQTPKNILKVKCPLTLMNCGKYLMWGSHGEDALMHAHMLKYLNENKHMHY